MRAAVASSDGVAVIDVDEDEVVEQDVSLTVTPATVALTLTLPRLVAADRHGATVIAVVERRPPLLISYDAGATWRETGVGLPAGFAVAISPEHPDLILYASRSRLHLSRDGGRFWQALTTEFHEIHAVVWLDSR